MNTRTHRPIAQSFAPTFYNRLATCARLVASVLAESMQALRAHSQRARDRAILSQLDSHALRDIGLCRSEFDSFRAESQGRVNLTRRRVAGTNAHRCQ